jgi:hypothetical protein
LGYFVWKITILRKQIFFFSNFRGGGARAGCASPLIRPWRVSSNSSNDPATKIPINQSS